VEIESARIFVKVVQLGSFTKAAGLLKLPKSTVSRTISRLEVEAGTKLLLRTTRSMTLTLAGQVFYESCLEPVLALEDARKTLLGKDSMLSGLIRLTAPEDLGLEMISPVLSKMTKSHPELNFELNYTDNVVDLVKEGYDIAIRLGKLSSSRYKAHRIGEIKMVLVASPQYFKGRSYPKFPEELIEHDCLSFNLGSATGTWVLTKNGSRTNVKAHVRIQANQMSSILKFASQGIGIGLLPYFLCSRLIESRELIRVLPEWEGLSYPVSIVVPPGHGHSKRLKVVIEHISKVMKETL
jgi:LysR family transcriptional regulator for bpeEF and oprC